MDNESILIPQEKQETLVFWTCLTILLDHLTKFIGGHHSYSCWNL